MGLKKSVEFGNIKIEVTKTAVYFNGEPFEHSDVVDLIDWLNTEVRPYAPVTMEQAIKAAQRYVVPAPMGIPAPQPEPKKVLRDEDLHPEKYAKLPSPDDLGNRTQGIEAAMAVSKKIGDSFKGQNIAMGNTTGQQILGVENVDLVKLASQAGQIVAEKRG